MIKSAYLRVYLPEDRIRAWDKHPESSPRRTRRWEPYGFIGESMIEDAWITEWRGGRFVCPRRPQLRMLEGVLALYNAFEVMGRVTIVPEEVARQADRELRKLRASEPDMKSQILTSAWHVPLRWFVPFAPEQRIYEQRENEDGTDHGSIRYRSPLPPAIQRANQAASVLTRAQLPESLIVELGHLSSWLGEFPSDSMLELDYGTVAELFSSADLALDESATEVWASIDALAAGNPDEAGLHYTNLMGRWSAAFAVAFSS
ncbi:MAG: hypothetical protein ACRDWA_06710 [Acidimicrobiia bacterium]